MIKAAIFDLDGTLLNRDESVKTFISAQHKRLKDQLGHIPESSYRERFIQLDQRGYVWKDKVYRQLIEEFNIPDVTWENMLEDYLKEFKHSCVPFPNMHQMLNELKGANLKLGMITNGFGQFQMDNIVALELHTYFDEILISEWEGLRKPDPAIFEKMVDRLNVEPGECIFLGDHPHNDVEGAQQAGMKGLWKKDHGWKQPANADAVIDDLLELPGYIKSLK
ncbi:HAD family hydrolase [Bacillus sp. KH172YL63]|uniref:HAD family hydrolase n=1 Tax=Bacillus sp. KH172YL63 TaxID=2709784 RepID=UPI0013E4AB85|nr:HAD family hydrolase [Bacillus sp. KH172YL63]BCB03684.1 haloacid dehalogenase [Bacillus sp. KH172YL63]